jgi:hypothetical protein
MINRRGQNIAEYSILIALVIAAAVAMNTFVKRGLQGRVHDAVNHTGAAVPMGDIGADFSFSTKQYEPYYANSTAVQTSARGSTETVDASGHIERTGIDERSAVKANSVDQVTAPQSE